MYNNIYIKNIFQSKFSECMCSASKWNTLEQPCHTKLPRGAFCDIVRYNYTDMIIFPIPKHYKVDGFESMLEVTVVKVNSKNWVTQQLIWPLLKVKHIQNDYTNTDIFTASMTKISFTSIVQPRFPKKTWGIYF